MSVRGAMSIRTNVAADLFHLALHPSGCGWVQREGGPIEEIRPSDVVWFSPGEKHWHGATPTTAITHIAIQEKKGDKVVDWMEHVTDEQMGASHFRAVQDLVYG